MLRNRLLAAVAGGAVLIGSAPVTAQSQTTTGPTATYWMTAQTSSGLPAMTPGRMDPMAMMQAMNAPGGVQHSLLLQLQSTQAPTGAVRAEHVPPAALQAGQRLPLASVERATGTADEGFEEMPRDQPRMLIYFGCGETARAPVTIRLDQEGARQFAAIAASGKVQQQRGPAPGAGKTYGEWPNARARQNVPASGSLVGEHLVRGSYTPDIRFSLTQDQDFLEPLVLTGVTATGPIRLGWNSVAGAQGYFAYTMGVNEAGDMVMWSSSDVATFPMIVPELLSPENLRTLKQRKVVLPATTTSCPVPSAVTAAAPESTLRVIAFGDETDIAWPPRPTDRRQPWNIEHVVKVRYNSTIGVMLGSDMDTGDGDGSEEAGANPLNPLDALPIPGAARALGSALGAFRRNRN